MYGGTFPPSHEKKDSASHFIEKHSQNNDLISNVMRSNDNNENDFHSFEKLSHYNDLKDLFQITWAEMGFHTIVSSRRPEFGWLVQGDVVGVDHLFGAISVLASAKICYYHLSSA